MTGGALRGGSVVVLVCPSLVLCASLTSACDCHSPALASTHSSVLDSRVYVSLFAPLLAVHLVSNIAAPCSLHLASVPLSCTYIVHCFQSISRCFISSFLVDATCLLSRSTLDPLFAVHRPSLIHSAALVHIVHYLRFLIQYISPACCLRSTYHHHSRLPRCNCCIAVLYVAYVTSPCSPQCESLGAADNLVLYFAFSRGSCGDSAPTICVVVK